MPMSNYLENAYLNHALRGGTADTSMAQPVAVYVSLHSADPTDDGSGLEITGGGYIRQQVTFGVPSNGVISNSEEVLFPIATASWGPISHMAIWDSATNGNMLYYGALSSSKTIGIDDQFRFPVGGISVTLD